jgi:hypothetical protein
VRPRGLEIVKLTPLPTSFVVLSNTPRVRQTPSYSSPFPSPKRWFGGKGLRLPPYFAENPSSPPSLASQYPPLSPAQILADALKRVDQMRAFIFGDVERDKEGKEDSAAAAQRDETVAALSRSIMESEVMPLALERMKALDFEARKGIAMIFNHVVRNDVSGFASDYMEHHSALLWQLVDAYSQADVALCCGSMLREAVKGYVRLHEATLYGADGGVSSPLRALFETHVHNPNFEVAADAFETLQTLLTANKPAVFTFLNPEGDEASLAR